MKRVYIIILHFKNLSITKNCILSLEKNEKSYKKIILVNNDQKNLSKKDLKFKNLIIINNKANLGFSKGMNIGISYALKQKADYILLLNNDAVVQNPFLDNLIKEMKDDNRIGISGPAVKFKKDNKAVFDIGGEINSLTGRTHHKEVEDVKEYMPRVVTYITGAVMLIKKEVFEKIGLFDESFFLYYEDVDFCLRAKKEGFVTIVDPKYSVLHLLSSTAGKVNTFAMYMQTKSAIIFGNKYFSSFPQNVINKFFISLQTILFFLLLYLEKKKNNKNHVKN